MDIDYKVENGKLLRLQVGVKSGVVEFIRLRGDFFMHPEERFAEIEQELAGVRVENIAQAFDEFVLKHKIKVVGFSGRDLQAAVSRAV